MDMPKGLTHTANCKYKIALLIVSIVKKMVITMTVDHEKEWLA